MKIKNCQTWIEDVVAKLMKENIVDTGALEAVETAPKS